MNSKSLDHNRISLSQEDWTVLLTGSVQKVFFFSQSYKEGDVVVRSGEKSSVIYQIIIGKCNIIKKTLNQPDEIVAVLAKGEIIGEISYILQAQTTAEVVAACDTEVCVIERNKLEIIFKRNPSLAGKFYHYLSKKISERIQPAKKN